ncbi:MAG TPA: alpha/beta fold hydrolase [Acidimicrobiales bacterium]|nr:alpha/beta fold hydrolase [Acidimicrobiales bacterium]
MSNPVVLVHGFGTSSDRTWRDNGWIDLLQDAGREVVAIDLLGHGRSDKPHDPAAYDDLEALVAAQLPDGPIDGVGFSLGARVLLTLATETPERFASLTLLGVGTNLLVTEGSGLIVDAIEGRGDPANPVVQYFAGLAAQPDVDRAALAACLRSARPALTPERLARATVPVRVVLGDQDFAGPGEPLVELLPDATLTMLPGVDHFATPKSFAAIDAVLEGLGAVP